MATHEDKRSGQERTKKRKERPRGRLVVAVNAKPRDYTPNSGPCVPRPTLLLSDDSTAYIRHRFLIRPKRVAKDGEWLPYSVSYLVEWRDLPCAKLLVPWGDILDYVSPAELERWEEDYEQELDEELLREEEMEGQEEENRLSSKPKPKGKKRGRPPKNTEVEAALAVDVEAERDDKVHLKGGALSMSTPKKYRMKDFEGLSDDDMSPSRQIERQLFSEEAHAVQMELDQMESAHHEEQPVDVDDIMQLDTDSMPRAEITPKATRREPVVSNSTSDEDPLASGDVNLIPDRLPKEELVVSWKHIGNNDRKAFSSLRPDFFGESSGQTSSRSSLAPAPESRESPKIKNNTQTPTQRPQPKAKVQKEKKEKKAPTTGKPKKAMKGAESDAEVSEKEWVVERIEDHEVYDVEGRLIRYFKVRWEGNWPADQNPSWEPEENLAPNSIRNYFKRGKQRRPHKGKPPPSKLKQTRLNWVKAKRYSNVSEAFEGDSNGDESFPREENDDPPPKRRNGVGPPRSSVTDSEQNDDREVFIVDEAFDAPSTPRFEWSANGIFR